MVKYMLILEDPTLVDLIDMDGIAKWLHSLRMYLSEWISGDTADEEANNLLTRQRIENKVRETLAYDGTKMRDLLAISSDVNLLSIPKNITNYANEGESYNNIYPKCFRISSREKMTNSPCDSTTNSTLLAESRAKSPDFPPNSPTTSPKINQNLNETIPPATYYANELRMVKMLMNYMELQPNQLLNLNISHCLNFYAFGLLTRLFDGFL